MKVLIWTDIFPTYSETFIRNHVVGLVNGKVDVFIHSDSKTKIDGKSIEDYQSYKLLDKTVSYEDYFLNNVILRAICAFVILSFSIFNGNFPYYLRTLNFKKFKKKAVSLRYFFILHFIIKKKIDIVHAHFGTNGRKLVFLKQINYPVKLIVTFHGYDLRIEKQYAKKFYRILFQYSDKIISISSYNYTTLVNLGLNKSKIFKLNNGIKIPENQSGFVKNNNKEIKILSIGRLVEEKGYDIAFEALRKLKDNNKDILFHYSIVGDGHLKEKLVHKVNKLQLQDYITFHFFQTSKFIHSILQESHFLLLTSLEESLPMVILEAQSFGLPVVATDVGSIKDIVNKNNGILVKPNIKSVYEGLIELINNRSNWFSLGVEARREVIKKYDENKQFEKLIKFYKELF